MEVKKIVDFLKENDLSEVEILKNENNILLVNFYLDFDSDILSAAKAYANDESSLEENSIEWTQDYYLPYLYDYANDEVLSIIEDISEEFEVAGEFMAFQLKEKKDEYVQFMTLFTEEDSDVSIEEVVKDFIG